MLPFKIMISFREFDESVQRNNIKYMHKQQQQGSEKDRSTP